jgi:serine/threonine protein phosphatase 1
LSKWRPASTGCLYIIPDIHGKNEELQLILKRILPLRNDKNAKDKIIFLGDYIDRGKDSPGVIDTLINLKEKYKDQVICLRGNHEWLMLASAGRCGGWSNPFKLSPFAIWVSNGGNECILQYAKRNGQNLYDGINISQEKAISFLDKKHLDFLENETVLYYELDNYIFVHAGCDPTEPLEQQAIEDEELFLWDRSLFETVRRLVNIGQDLPWEKIVVTGHNYRGPYITSKFMMLDASASNKLLIVELNTMEGFAAIPDNKRLVKVNLTEKQAAKSSTRVLFRREDA